jgi:hypothetical protein
VEYINNSINKQNKRVDKILELNWMQMIKLD